MFSRVCRPIECLISQGWLCKRTIRSQFVNVYHIDIFLIIGFRHRRDGKESRVRSCQPMLTRGNILTIEKNNACCICTLSWDSAKIHLITSRSKPATPKNPRVGDIEASWPGRTVQKDDAPRRTGCWSRQEFRGFMERRSYGCLATRPGT